MRSGIRSRSFSPVEQRIKTRTVPADGDRCWTWNGCHSSSGYARINICGTITYVHRVVVEIAIGRLLKSTEHVDHLCRNRGCVRPSHLDVVTSAINTRRGKATKVTAAQVAAIISERREGATTVALGRKYGLHSSEISRICTGKRFVDNDRAHHAQTRKRNKEDNA